jgi:hypothetical protein
MHLDSYNCELCILQREETLGHLFFKCSFARNCWQLIGVVVPSWLRPERVTRHLKRALGFHSLWNSLFSCVGPYGRKETLGFSTMKTLPLRNANLPLRGNLRWSFIGQENIMYQIWNCGLVQSFRRLLFLFFSFDVP